MKTKYTTVITSKVKQSHKLKLKLNRLPRHSCLIPRNDEIKKILFLFAVLFSISSYSQTPNKNLKEYSYAQLFDMIAKEKDSVFTLKDAHIKYNAKTDSLLTTTKYGFMNVTPVNKSPKKIVIDKQLKFTNVYFSDKFYRADIEDDSSSAYYGGYLFNLHCKENVEFRNVLGLQLHNSIFEKEFRFFNNTIFQLENKFFRDKKIQQGFSISKNIFKKGVDINNYTNTPFQDKAPFIEFYKNTIYTNYSEQKPEVNNRFHIRMNEINNFAIIADNIIKGEGISRLVFTKNKQLSFVNNKFESPRVTFAIKETIDNLVVKENSFSKGVRLNFTHLKPSDLIEWKQFNNSITSFNAFDNYTALLPDKEYEEIQSDSFATYYKEELRFKNLEVYGGEAALRGALYRHYRENFDMVSANAVYMNLKDFETKHLEFMYEANPSFDSFFQWKVNQFLKVFSNYGTKPSKAITFSVYVIFVFALFYLFFPNSWDRYGKNRILDRYSFFLKYMDKKAGIHEVYLEGQKEEILAYDEYKKLIEKSDKRVPKFFTATVLPIYKWSVAGTQLSTSFLRKIDVMKGTWSELPKSKRIWKSILLVTVFLIAILYDVFIKVLNALMLSINTFTTLGFGEIPIKGLPRYLAIIQGFIGWFMLTIFSVSLISQLLN